MKHTLTAIVLVLYFAAPVAAGPFEDAVEAHSRGDSQKALRLIRPLANDGDAVAQFNLGLMYATGQGVQQDDAAAALWFRKAGEQGYAPAQSNLGTVYPYGRGVTQGRYRGSSVVSEGCRPRRRHCRVSTREPIRKRQRRTAGL